MWPSIAVHPAGFSWPESNLRGSDKTALAKTSIDGIDDPTEVIMIFGVWDYPPLVGPDHDGGDTRIAEYEAWSSAARHLSRGVRTIREISCSRRSETVNSERFRSPLWEEPLSGGQDRGPHNREGQAQRGWHQRIPQRVSSSLYPEARTTIGGKT